MYDKLSTNYDQEQGSTATRSAGDGCEKQSSPSLPLKLDSPARNEANVSSPPKLPSAPKVQASHSKLSTSVTDTADSRLRIRRKSKEAVVTDNPPHPSSQPVLRDTSSSSDSTRVTSVHEVSFVQALARGIINTPNSPAKSQVRYSQLTRSSFSQRKPRL